jgi:hypothetical protein
VAGDTLEVDGYDNNDGGGTQVCTGSAVLSPTDITAGTVSIAVALTGTGKGGVDLPVKFYNAWSDASLKITRVDTDWYDNINDYIKGYSDSTQPVTYVSGTPAAGQTAFDTETDPVNDQFTLNKPVSPGLAAGSWLVKMDFIRANGDTALSMVESVIIPAGETVNAWLKAGSSTAVDTLSLAQSDFALAEISGFSIDSGTVGGTAGLFSPSADGLSYTGTNSNTGPWKISYTNTNNYSVEVEGKVDDTAVSAGSYTSGAAIGSGISATVGAENNISLTVTARDGMTKKLYRFVYTYLSSTGTEYYVSGTGGDDANGHDGSVSLPFKTVSRAVDGITSGQTRIINICNAVTESAAITINAGTVVLQQWAGNSAGSITTSGSSHILTVSNSAAKLILDDDITISGGQDSGIRINSSTFIMNGGTISGNSASDDGGGVCVSGGTFIMNGGTISNNQCGVIAGPVYDNESRGGGVCISGGTFTMNGGTISGNTVGGCGGGVSNAGTFIMNGGTISGNKAPYRYTGIGGAGVYNSGTFTMHGGTISNNSVTNGGGVYVTGSGAIFTMSGGTISDNIASGSGPGQGGGGVYADSTGAFTMTGGTISGNNASDGFGGGVFAWGTTVLSGGAISSNVSTNGSGAGLAVYGSCTLSGNVAITGNTSNDDGGGAYVSSGATLDMSGGTISGNIANHMGGGVDISGSFTMSGGVINGNTASYTGNGVEVDGTFKMKGTALVMPDNEVYLSGAGFYINLDGDLSAQPGGLIASPVAVIMPYPGTVGDTILTGPSYLANNYYHFALTPQIGHSRYIDQNGTLQDGARASRTVGGQTFYYDTLASAISAAGGTTYTPDVITLLGTLPLDYSSYSGGSRINVQTNQYIELTADSAVTLKTSDGTLAGLFVLSGGGNLGSHVTVDTSKITLAGP